MAKCKTGFKMKGNKCVSKRSSKRKNPNRSRKLIAMIIFVVFTSVLFINNATQLLGNWFNLTYLQINVIAWLGIIAALLYFAWLWSGGELDRK